MTRQFTCPEDQLPGEIGFSITYAVACNPGRPLLDERLRIQFVRLITATILERARNGLSGMAIADDVQVEAPGKANRA